ncbi:MAG: ATP-binding cassette domain-containing protein [Eubacterium sp.]|nr:ATP-binding cassette domain-containing protein [Eubacterium sp.]
MAYIEIKNLKFKYPEREREILSDVNLSVEKGEIVVVCGKTGSGKSTLLRNLKKEIAPAGDLDGEIQIEAERIGFVFQNPEHQIVTDKVYSELAFTLENEGVPTDEIKLRVAEISEYFGITDWYFKKVDELSGGQKQILNLASTMVADPQILILDEPIAMLDPIAKETLLHLLGRINRDFGTTIVMAEHDVKKVEYLANKIVALKDGKISEDVGEWLVEKKIEKIFSGSDEKVLECKNVWFRYHKHSPDVLRGLNFSVNKGETFCMLGGNGTGKTTALMILSKVLKAYRGKVKIDKKIGLMPQDAKQLFAYETLREELDNSYEDKSIMNKVIEEYKFENLLDTHPYDLSGGEQELLGIAKIMSAEPDILLLDEPTKGMDIFLKEDIARMFDTIKREGKTIILVTHDVEFCKIVADRCGLFAQGELIGVNKTEEFFKNMKFYK